MSVSFGEKGVKTKYQYRYPKEEPLNDKEHVYTYLAQRHISQTTVDAVDVREDAHGNIVFNYYDTNDVLCLVKYRPSHKIDKANGEIKAWCQKDADTTPLLFNMNRVNTTSPLLICEGEIDCMAAIEAGFTNAVSVPLGANNYGWIEENFDWLEQFESIIICSDNDEAGIKMQKECVFRLGSWRTKVVGIPLFHYDAEQDKRFPMKDLNHVLYYEGKDAVLELIHNAKDTPVDSVSDFSDITNIDLDQIDGIKTGIPDLDKKLMKLFYGTFTIVTGVNGSGKSSFLSQLICNAVDEDKNAFLYSGELPNFQSKNWINYILAGQRNVREYNFNGATYWKVTPEAQKAMNEYYRGRLFIYKDGYDHSTGADSNNLYTEYIYVSSSWEILGTQKLDLTGYAKEDWVSAQISGFVTEARVQELIAAASFKAADTADKLATARKISISGDVIGEATFDGSDDSDIAVELSKTGVAAGVYTAVEVDEKGRVTAGSMAIEIGTAGQTTPSQDLAIGGLFFKLL